MAQYFVGFHLCSFNLRAFELQYVSCLIAIDLLSLYCIFKREGQLQPQSPNIRYSNFKFKSLWAFEVGDDEKWWLAKSTFTIRSCKRYNMEDTTGSKWSG